MVDLPDKERGCHKTGFTRKCRDLVVNGECDRWMQIQGKNPNTGEDINESKCIDDWLPILLMENSQMQRQTGAAVESFRNEMVRQNNALTGQMRQVSDESVNAYIAPPDEEGRK